MVGNYRHCVVFSGLGGCLIGRGNWGIFLQMMLHYISGGGGLEYWVRINFWVIQQTQLILNLLGNPAQVFYKWVGATQLICSIGAGGSATVGGR